MCLKKCASQDREARQKGMRGNKQPATYSGERVGDMVRGNLAEWRNTTFLVVIHQVPNGNNDQKSSD